MLAPQRRAHAAVRDPPDPARVAHGSAHRRRVRDAARDTAGRARYAEAVDRDSAAEKLARENEPETAPAGRSRPGARRRAARPEGVDARSQILNSPLARTVAGAVTRGLMGAMLGPTRRRPRY